MLRKKSKLFLINGSILTLTALGIKFASLIFNVYISNKIGSEAMGIFALVMSIYLFFITLSISGLNIASTIIISEKFAIDKPKDAIKTMKTCLFYCLLIGTTSGFLIIILSNIIGKIFLHNLISNRCLICIALGLPFISMSSCLNSYFSCIRKAFKTAIAQIFEFIIKIIITIILLKIYLYKGVEYVCISLILGDVIAELFSFALLYLFYKIDIKSKKLNFINSFGEKIRIIKIALPIALTSYIRSGLSSFKHLIIPYQLEKSGMSCSNSLSNYGIIHGMVLPVIIFPTFFIYSFCDLIIPELSAYVAQKKYESINFISTKILKLTSNFSICITAIFFIFSNDLGFCIYNNVETGFYFKIFSPLVFFFYMDHAIDSILKGLNKQFNVMMCNIVELIITISFIFILLPKLGIKGYIISIYSSEVINCTISLIQLIKYSKLKLNFKDWILIPISSCTLSYLSILIFNFKLNNIYLNLTLNIILFTLSYTTIILLLTKKVIKS